MIFFFLFDTADTYSTWVMKSHMFEISLMLMTRWAFGTIVVLMIRLH